MSNPFLDLMLQDSDQLLKPKIVNKPPRSDNGIKIKGKTFVFGAGKLEKFTRSEAEKEVIKLGGYIKNSMTKDVDYLVTPNKADKTASKLKLAAQMKKKILTEEEFIKALEENA